MALPISPLDKYISNYEEVTNCKRRHIFAVSLGVIGGGLCGLLFYFMLTNGAIPLGFSSMGNILAAVAIGGFTTAALVEGVVIHYLFRSKHSLIGSSKEAFFKALIALDSDDTVNSLTLLHFKSLISTEFTDTNWQVMFQMFDAKFFPRTGSHYNDDTIYFIYGLFYYADPQSFTNSFHALNEQGKLTQENRAYLLNEIPRTGLEQANFPFEKISTHIKCVLCN